MLRSLSLRVCLLPHYSTRPFSEPVAMTVSAFLKVVLLELASLLPPVTSRITVVWRKDSGRATFRVQA